MSSSTTSVGECSGEATVTGSAALVRRSVIVFQSVLAVAATAAQLWVSGWGRVLLFAVVVASAGQLFWKLSGRPRLRKQLAARDRQLRQYRAVLAQLVDQQYDSCRESVRITIDIAASDGRDRVVEKHSTMPLRRLHHRLIRPISATTGRQRPTYDEMDITVVSADNHVSVDLLPVTEDVFGTQTLVTFQPGRNEEIDWVVSYKAPRLLDPLRQDGVDRIRWSPLPYDGSGTETVISTLTLEFVFPISAPYGSVREVKDLGSLASSTDLDGRRRITWSCDRPDVALYEWELTVNRPRPK